MMARWNTCKCSRQTWRHIRRKSPIPQVAHRCPHIEDYPHRSPTLVHGRQSVQWYDNRHGDSWYVQFSTTVEIKNRRNTISYSTIYKTTYDLCNGVQVCNNRNFSGVVIFFKLEIDIPVDPVYDVVVATADRRRAVNLRAFKFRCHGIKKWIER